MVHHYNEQELKNIIKKAVKSDLKKIGYININNVEFIQEKGQPLQCKVVTSEVDEDIINNI
jgi:hypothetical protein